MSVSIHGEKAGSSKKPEKSLPPKVAENEQVTRNRTSVMLEPYPQGA